MPKFIPEHTPEHVDTFTRGYLDAAEWLLDEEIDRDAVEGWSAEALAQATADCTAFQRANAADLESYAKQYKPRGAYDPAECAGHDFFLTRNGLGVGFWDRGLSYLGDRLTEAAQRFREANAYLGDDGFLYFF